MSNRIFDNTQDGLLPTPKYHQHCAHTAANTKQDLRDTSTIRAGYTMSGSKIFHWFVKSCANGANCALCEMTWLWVLSLSFSASNTSISGAPRPPGWSEPGHEQTLRTNIMSDQDKDAKRRVTYLGRWPLNQLGSKLYLSLEESEGSAAAGPSLSLSIWSRSVPTPHLLYLQSRNRVSTE